MRSASGTNLPILGVALLHIQIPLNKTDGVFLAYRD
jgi:hypothetical protein